MVPESDELLLGGMDAGRHKVESDFCCPGLSVVQTEMPLLVNGVLRKVRDNDRLYMKLFEASDNRVLVAMGEADKAMGTALAVTKEAAVEAKLATEKRFDEVGEKLDALRDSLSAQITAATTAAALTTGRSGGFKDSWGYLVGAAGIGGMVIAAVMAITAK